jgi:uncharacterized membrane protein (UPF0136 family)
MMKFMPWVVIAYAVVILGGGMMGYAKAHSWASIIMGTVSAILLICAAIAMFNKSVLGYFGAMGIAFILSIFFTYRFFQAFKMMPSGLMAVLSILTFVVLAAARLKP